jgi:hypothetical protein
MKQREGELQNSPAPSESIKHYEYVNGTRTQADFMKKDSEQKPSLLSEEEKKLWDFYPTVGIQGAEELKL